MSQFFYELRDLVSNWHRDERGIDQTIVGEISLGLTLSNFIWQSSASIIRYSIHYQDQIDEHGMITIPPDATELQRRVAQKVGAWFDGSAPQFVIPYADEQYLTSATIHVPRVATAVRQLQPLLKIGMRKNSRLWITDWTTHHTSRASGDSMVLYHRSPLRSAIPHTTARDRRHAERVLPVDLKEYLNEQVLLKFLNRRGYAWPDAIANMMSDYLQVTYRQIRSSLVISLAQTLNMLRFYSPSKVALPADALESWNMIYQVCANRGIPTTMYMDGYAIIPFNPMMRNRDDTDWVVNRIAAYGSGQREMYLRQGFPKERVEVVPPPFLSWVTENRSDSQTFDAVVLAWTINVLNPSSKFWAPLDSLRSVLRVLMATGHKRIAVKIRHHNEIPYVRFVCEELGIHVEILTGKFYLHATKAPLFIGGISTAFAEVVGRGGRYVLYEPLKNGYSDELLRHSTVLTRELTARNEFELREMIETGRCSWLGEATENLF